jgi:hypothetical protein
MRKLKPRSFTLEDQLLAESTYFSRKNLLSYSSINLLLYSPTIWYGKYILRLEEEDQLLTHLIEGKVVHCLLLEKDHFDKHFIVSPGVVPTGNILKVVNTVFESNFDEIFDPNDPRTDLVHFDAEILDYLKEIDLYQTFTTTKATKNDPNPKTGDAKRLEKIITPENEDYWKFLLKRGKQKKDIIDEETLKKCRDAVEILKLAPNVMRLLGLKIDPFKDKVEVFNEEYMEATMTRYSWGLKGFLDNVKIDHNARVIHINDIKTTAKTLANFKDSLELYSYWLQASIYILLIIARFKHLIDAGYRYQFLQVYAFPVSQETLDAWTDRTLEVFEKVNYHYTTKRFDLPYEFDKGLVTL